MGIATVKTFGLEAEKGVAAASGVTSANGGKSSHDAASAAAIVLSVAQGHTTTDCSGHVFVT